MLATVEKYGGRYLMVGGQCDVVEGSWRPVFPVLIRFRVSTTPIAGTTRRSIET